MNIIFKNESNILLTSRDHIDYRLQKYLGFPQLFPNEIFNFGSLWRHGVTQRHRFEKSHKWALLSRHEQLRKTCKQINKDHQDSFSNVGNFFKYLKNQLFIYRLWMFSYSKPFQYHLRRFMILDDLY